MTLSDLLVAEAKLSAELVIAIDENNQLETWARVEYRSGRLAGYKLVDVGREGDR